MARLLLPLLLLLANAGYFLWSQGLLRDWGLAPAAQTEPQRLAQQIRPELMRIGATPGVDPPTAPDAAASAPEATAASAAPVAAQAQQPRP